MSITAEQQTAWLQMVGLLQVVNLGEVDTETGQRGAKLGDVLGVLNEINSLISTSDLGTKANEILLSVLSQNSARTEQAIGESNLAVYDLKSKIDELATMLPLITTFMTSFGTLYPALGVVAPVIELPSEPE